MKRLLISSINTAIDLGFNGSNKYRTIDYVQQKISEELFEVAEELEKKLKGKDCGKDGIKGEIIDTLLSVIDFYVLLKLKNRNKDDCVSLLESMIDTFEISDLDVAFELDNTESQVANLLELIKQGQFFSVFVQIQNGTSCELPRPKGHGFS